MGDAQSIPVVGEVVTTIESGTKIVAAGACAIVGATDTAEDLANGAGRSWVEYSEKNILAGSINALVHTANGDDAGADRIMNKSLQALENVADSTPVVGHVKGTVHYIAGDEEHGNKCMYNASRSTAVMGAGLVTGGLGGGAVLGGLAGLEAGMAYDLTSTVIQQEEAGCVQGLKEAIENKDPNKVVDFGLGLAGDFAGGYSGAQYGEALRVKLQEYSLENSYNNLKDSGKVPSDFDPKTATADTIDAAKTMDKQVQSGAIKRDGHVSTRVRNLDTQEVSQGYNARARADINQAAFEKQGTKSGFASKTNARKTGLGGKSQLKQMQPDVKPALKRNVAYCAEHDAFNNYYKQPKTASGGRPQTVSVKYQDGSFTTVERCSNCQQYDMGRVPTDAASGKTVPTTDASTHVINGTHDALLRKTNREKGKKKKRE